MTVKIAVMTMSSSAPQHDKWIVLSRKHSNNSVRKVWRKKLTDGTYKYKRSVDNPNPDSKDGKWKARFGKKTAAKDAQKWSEKDGNESCYVSKDLYPFCVLGGGVFGNEKLTDKMNKLGKSQKKYMRLGSYKRTQQQQHDLYLKYIRGTGNLAAYCNTKYRGEHSWDSCKKYPPCNSNHCSGGACDLSYYHQGRSGSYTNVGNNNNFRNKMKSLGLCLPVGGEAWHTEIGTTWRS